MKKTAVFLFVLSAIFNPFISVTHSQTSLPLQEGKIRRFGIGVGLKQPAPDMVTLLTVVKNGPAEKAGLKAGDIIRSVAGIPVKKRIDVVEACQGRNHNDTVEIRYERDGSARTTKIPLGYVIDSPGYIDGILLMLYDDRPVNLAIVATVKNLLLKGTALKEWNTGARDALVADTEAAILERFRNEKKFSLIDRNRVSEITGEVTMNQAGLTSRATTMKFGSMLGATHILFLDLTRYPPNTRGIMEDQTSRRLIEIESGKVISSDVVKDETKVQ